jgi:hypothetical protein
MKVIEHSDLGFPSLLWLLNLALLPVCYDHGDPSVWISQVASHADRCLYCLQPNSFLQNKISPAWYESPQFCMILNSTLIYLVR